MLYVSGYTRNCHSPESVFSAFLAVTATLLTVNDSTLLGTETLMDLISGVVICQFGKIRNLLPDLRIVSSSSTVSPFNE